MLLPLLIIIIASTATYFAWHSARTTIEKSVAVAGYVIVLAICYKYITLARVSTMVQEAFDVEMPNIDEMLDEERDNAEKESTDTNTNKKAVDDDEPATEPTKPVVPKKTPIEFIRVDDAKRFGEEQLTGLATMTKGVEGPRTVFPTTESTDMRNTVRGGLQSTERFRGDLPGADSRSVDHMPFREETENFNNISQEKTDGMSSVFNPQIIINNPGGGSTTGDGINSFIDEYTTRVDVDRFTGGSHQSSKSNLPKSTIQSYLEPKQDIFNRSQDQQANDFQDTDADRAWKWMSNFIAKNRAGPNSGSGKNNDATSSGDISSCSVARPYAEENGKFNTATLNNRSFVPGMSYLPPTEWTVPQYHPTYCRAVCPVSNPNTRELPIGIMDHGTPIFALEIGSDGNIAKTEEEVTLTNVGSICPKFVYREYVECPSKLYMGKPSPDTITKPITKNNNNKGSNAIPPEIFNKEPAAGTKFMDGWVASVYTQEQQARLGVDEFGNPRKA